MTSPKPLPPVLAAGPFTVAEARELGVGRSRLRHSSLHAPTSAVRCDVQPDNVLALARSIGLVLPHPWAFSHLTAARLLSLPLPTVWSPSEGLHVLRPSQHTRIRRAGVLGHRGLESRELMSIHGLPLTSPQDTWLDLATLLDVDDLVVAGDAVANRVDQAVEDLALRLSARPRGRGRRRALRAVSLIRPGSGSAMESRARLAFLRGGLPEPELNASIVDGAGEWLATGDFVWREQRVVVEYEGDHHRQDRKQWQSDVARTRLLEALGWRVIRITARDLAADRVADTVRLIATALTRPSSTRGVP